MVQLLILSGKKAGTQFSAPSLPLLVGRDSNAALSLEEPGVFPRHFQITRRDRDLVLTAEPNALVSINGSEVQEAALRSGDVISIGAARLRFGLSPMKQRSLSLRESLTWTAIIALCVIEIIVIERLLH